MNTAGRLLGLGLVTLAVLLGAVVIGPTRLLDVGVLWHLLVGGGEPDTLERGRLVLMELRLPRVLLAAAAGVNLALGGLILQAIFRNPLAEPYLLGLSSGGALGAVVALACGATSVLWPALTGALGVAGLVLLLCRRSLASDLPSLLLAGVALGALGQALTSGLLLRFDPGAMRSIMFWLMGSFADGGWSGVLLVGGAAVAGVVLVAVWSRPLDLLVAGGESAHHLGVPVRVLQAGGIMAAAGLAAVTVAVCGTVGFVGLMAPHLARRLAGPQHAAALPATVCCGVILTVASDLAARVAFPGTELPVGIVTGALGALFFLALLAGRR